MEIIYECVCVCVRANVCTSFTKSETFLKGPFLLCGYFFFKFSLLYEYQDNRAPFFSF